MRKLTIVCILTLLLLVSDMALSVPRYTATVLPLVPNSINNKGHIAGEYIHPKNKERKCALYINGKITDLDPNNKYLKFSIYRTVMTIQGINDADEIVGEYSTTDPHSQYHAFYWSKGKFTDIGCFGAYRINNKGQIIGRAVNRKEDSYDAVYWANYKAKPSNLSVKYGWRRSRVRSINNRGDIVGSWLDKRSVSHPLFIKNGKLINLRLPGVKNTKYYNVAVNDSRLIMGYIIDHDDIYELKEHAYVLKNGKIRDLGLMNGHPVFPKRMNSQGLIVGGSEDANHRMVPFLWYKGHYYNLYDLMTNGSDLTIRDVRDFNNSGEIVAMGYDKNGKDIGILLRPK